MTVSSACLGLLSLTLDLLPTLVGEAVSFLFRMARL
jgi:hypothetical protein